MLENETIPVIEAEYDRLQAGWRAIVAVHRPDWDLLAKLHRRLQSLEFAARAGPSTEIRDGGSV